MIWLIEAGLVLLLLGFGWSRFSRRRRSADPETITNRRVEAYMATLRRERSNPRLSAMTDLELRDVLLSAAHNLRVEGERKITVLLGVAGVTLVSAVGIATQDGVRGFALTLAVGAVVLYGLNEWLTRRMREPIVAQGLDIERLKVD